MLTLLLAQTEVPPAQLASWISVAMYLIGCAAGVVGLLVGIKSLRTPKPEPTEIAQPVHTKAVHDFATKPELTALQGKMEAELSRERFSRKGLYERQELMGNRVTRIEEKTDAQTVQLNKMDTKMDQVLLRLPRSPSS